MATKWKQVILRTGDGCYRFENIPEGIDRWEVRVRNRPEEAIIGRRVFGMSGNELPPAVPTHRRFYQHVGHFWETDMGVEIWDEVL